MVEPSLRGRGGGIGHGSMVESSSECERRGRERGPTDGALRPLRLLWGLEELKRSTIVGRVGDLREEIAEAGVASSSHFFLFGLGDPGIERSWSKLMASSMSFARELENLAGETCLEGPDVKLVDGGTDEEASVSPPCIGSMSIGWEEFKGGREGEDSLELLPCWIAGDRAGAKSVGASISEEARKEGGIIELDVS
jgi:hypothetical protein